MSYPSKPIGAPDVSRRIDDIEVLRAVAVLMVAASHENALLFWRAGKPPTSLLDYFGFGCGVDVFFVISGFVIARSLMAELIDNKDRIEAFRISVAFWIRRAFRLLPLAWLWATVTLLAVRYFNKSSHLGPLDVNFNSFVAAMTETMNFRAHELESSGRPVGTLVVYWSLSLEEQFYLVFPLFLIFLSTAKRARTVAIALFVIQFLIPDRNWPTLLWFTRTDGLLLGIFIAMSESSAFRGGFEPRFLGGSRLARWLFLPIIVFLLGGINNGRVTLLVQQQVIVVLSGALVWAASFNRSYIMNRGILKKIFVWIGGRSYAIYVSQNFFFALPHELMVRFAPNITPDSRLTLPFMIISAVPMCITAELIYRFYERPLRIKGQVLAQQYLRKKDAFPPVGLEAAHEDKVTGT
jgi:peptidoglycan/LPS O-acetylase OafA/YrhL